MDFVAIDRFETAFGEVRLRGRREQIELADAARCEAIDELPDDAPSDAAPAMRAGDRHRPDQRREFVRLGTAAADDRLAVARDDERLPVILDATRRQIIGDEELPDDGKIGLRGAADRDIAVAHARPRIATGFAAVTSRQLANR